MSKVGKKEKHMELKISVTGQILRLEISTEITGNDSQK
jgi:hypothetical protein